MSYGEGKPDYSIRKVETFSDNRGYGEKYYNRDGVLVGESITTHFRLEHTHENLDLKVERGPENQDRQLEFDFDAPGSDEAVEWRAENPEDMKEREAAE